MVRLVVSVAVVAAMVMASGRADALVLCAKAKKGALKEGAPIKIRSACTAKEVQVDPDATGLRGPQGPAGTPGTNGAPGTNGTDGVSGLELVTANGGTIIAGLLASFATASCPPGKKVVGGGVDTVLLAGSFSDRMVTASRPVIAGDDHAWFGEVVAQASDDWHAVVYALCATAP